MKLQACFLGTEVFSLEFVEGLGKGITILFMQSYTADDQVVIGRVLRPPRFVEVQEIDGVSPNAKMESIRGNAYAEPPD